MHDPPTIVYPANGNLYLNLTNRCSCDCTFCLRRFTWEVYGYDLRLRAEPSIPHALAALEEELEKGRPDQIVFCGLGEPTLRLDALLEITGRATEQGLPTRLDTNGCGRLSNPDVDVVAALAGAGLGAVSVSLNAPDAATYERLCRPRYRGAHRAVVRFAEDCIAAGIETTLSALDGLGADLDECAVVADRMGAAFRVRGCARPRRADRPASRPTTAGRPAASTVRRFEPGSPPGRPSAPRCHSGLSHQEARP